MTDQEVDRLMRRILLDSLKSEWDQNVEEMPALEASVHYQRQIRRMLANPLGWAQRKTKPVWKKVLQRVAVILIVSFLALGSLMAVSSTVEAAVVR